MNIKRSTALGKLLLASCLMLALTAAFVTAAEEKYVCTGAEMKEYANMVFCLPEDVAIEPESIVEANYTGGKEIAASLLLNGDRVGLHLIYPCQSPDKKLNREELKGFMESYNPILAETKYNDTFPEPAIWGQVGDQMLVAYQPSNQTVALVLMDINMSDTMKADFIDNLSISINEGMTPLTPGSCPDTTIGDGAVEGAAAAEQTVATGAETESTAAAAVSTEAKPATGKEKMSTDIDAARKRIEELRKGR